MFTLACCLPLAVRRPSLQDLQVGLWTPQSSTDSWLPALTSLQHLRLGTVARPLQLPLGISSLQALVNAELTGCPLELGYARLPPSLTGLCLRDMASTALPHQVGSPAGGDAHGGSCDGRWAGCAGHCPRESASTSS